MDTNPICHLSPAKKMKCLFLDYVQLLMIGQAGQRTPTPSVTPLQPKKWNACFCIMVNFWWSARLVDELESHLPPLSSQNNEMLIFGLCWTSDSRLGWSMDSNPIHHLSPAKEWNAHFWITFNFWWSAGLVDGLEPHLQPLFNQKMKCLFLYYVIVQIISWAGWWTQSPSTTPQAKKWNANFCITFNFWWLAGLVDGLEPHPLPFSSQKNEMLIFVLHSTSDDWPGWSLDLNPIHLLSQAKKNEMLIFGLLLTSDDQPGWLMNLNPICHPSPARKMKCSFLDYVQLLMIGRAGQWTRIPSTTCLQPKNEMLIFGLHSTCDDQPGWLMNLNPICHPSPAKKMKCLFLDYFQFLVIIQVGRWTRMLSTTPLQPKNEMLIFRLRSTSDDQLGWSMDSNLICYPSPNIKMICSFLYYVQLLMIGQAGRRTRTPSVTPLHPEKWNACFGIMFNFWWSAGLVDGLKPHLPPLSSQKNEMLIFVLHSTSDDWPG